MKTTKNWAIIDVYTSINILKNQIQNMHHSEKIIH